MLQRFPSCKRAGAITPAGAARCIGRLPSRTAGGLPLISGGSAPATPFSRPARRSLAFRPACSLSRPMAALSHQSASAYIVTSVNRSGCFQPKRQGLCGVRTHWENAPFHGALRIGGYFREIRHPGASGFLSPGFPAIVRSTGRDRNVRQPGVSAFHAAAKAVLLGQAPGMATWMRRALIVTLAPMRNSLRRTVIGLAFASGVVASARRTRL